MAIYPLLPQGFEAFDGDLFGRGEMLRFAQVACGEQWLTERGLPRGVGGDSVAQLEEALGVADVDAKQMLAAYREAITHATEAAAEEAPVAADAGAEEEKEEAPPPPAEEGHGMPPAEQESEEEDSEEEEQEESGSESESGEEDEDEEDDSDDDDDRRRE